MSNPIGWTSQTWNPIRGCSRVSAGCDSCYAIREARRHDHPGGPYEGLTRTRDGKLDWSAKIRLVPEKLDEPLRWRKPRRIFVNSMSDLFHEKVPDEFIDRVFAVMALAPHHTFQVLTKRPERMRAWFFRREGQYSNGAQLKVYHALAGYGSTWSGVTPGKNARRMRDLIEPSGWPLPNVHLGVSVEDQQTADERIPLLLQTPAAVRWVSAEPLLGPVDMRKHLTGAKSFHMRADVAGMLRNRAFVGLSEGGRPLTEREAETHMRRLLADGVRFVPAAGCDDFDPENGCRGHSNAHLDWVVVGGESGPGARPCDVSWIRSVVEQCKAANTPVYVKQLGAKPGIRNRAGGFNRWRVGHGDVYVRDRKGADMGEWPEDLRVREWPK